MLLIAKALNPKLILSVFNEVAEHDVGWEEYATRYLSNILPYERWSDFYLSLGLKYIHRLVNTTTYDGRRHLFWERCSGTICSLLDAWLRENSTESSEEDDDRPLFPQNSSSPLCVDDDKGPEEAWRWAYCEEIYAYQFNVSE